MAVFKFVDVNKKQNMEKLTFNEIWNFSLSELNLHCAKYDIDTRI